MLKLVGRTLLFIASIIGLIFNLIELWVDYLCLSISLAILLIAIFVVSVYPLLRWWCHMFKFIWNIWRNPSKFFFVRNLNLNLRMKSESGEYEWACGLEVISLIPWNKKMNIIVEVREPDKIAGMIGEFTKDIVIKGLSNNKVSMTRFSMTDKRRSYIDSSMNDSSYLPVGLMIMARDSRNKCTIWESMNFVFQGSK